MSLGKTLKVLIFLSREEADALYAPIGTTIPFFEGSGLYEDVNTVTHVGVGYGLSVSDSGVYLNVQQVDQRYAYSGVYVHSGEVYTKDEIDYLISTIEISGIGIVMEAGSGLIEMDGTFHVQIGSGLYLQDDLVGFDIQAEQARILALTSGVSYTKVESDQRYQLSGNRHFEEEFSAVGFYQVNHGLGTYPQVRVLDSGLSRVEVQTIDLSTSGLRLQFLGPIISGRVLCDTGF